MSKIADFFNPKRKPGGVWPILVLAVLVLSTFVAGAGSGWLARGHYDRAAHFKHRYGTGLLWYGEHAPKPTGPPTAIRVTAPPPSAKINTAIYPAVGDQGSIGSCAAWASAWAASFEYRMQHPGSYLRFSPRWEYDWFTRGNGDGGSFVSGDLSVLPTLGIPRFKQFPYPPYRLDWPVPNVDTQGASLDSDAAALKQPINVTQGPVNSTSVDWIKSEIVLGHPVMIAFAVYDSYMNSTGYVEDPQPGEQWQGGHENVIIAYDDNKIFPSGAVGGVLLQNQWSREWGHNGRAWLSYAAIRDTTNFLYDLNGIRLGNQAFKDIGPCNACGRNKHKKH